MKFKTSIYYLLISCIKLTEPIVAASVVKGFHALADQWKLSYSFICEKVLSQEALLPSSPLHSRFPWLQPAQNIE